MRNPTLLALFVLGSVGLVTGAATLAPAAELCSEEMSRSDAECPDSGCPVDDSLKAPSHFSVGFDGAGFDATGRHEGWSMAFSVDNWSGHVCRERYDSENGMVSQPLGAVDADALSAASRELARRLVLGEVHAVHGREVRRIQFGYDDEESTTSFQGMFTYSEADDLPREIEDFACEAKLPGCRLPPLPDECTSVGIESFPSMAYLRIYRRLDNGGRREWVRLLDMTLHDGSKDNRSCEPGKTEHLAFLASTDRKFVKLTVKTLVQRIVEDELEGMRADKRGDTVLQVGYAHLNAFVSAQFHYASEEEVAKGLREILAVIEQGESGGDSSNPASPEIF